MKRIFTLRNMLALLGALVIGALGSGLWDVLFKPIFVWIGSILLNVATLGIQSLIDEIYMEVARGSYERASDAVHQTIVVIFGCAMIGVPLIALLVVRAADGDEQDDWSALQEDRRRKLRTVVLAALIVESLGAGILLVGVARLSYIIRASNYLEQCERVVAPALTPDQRVLIASRVAQIQSKQDFIKIVEELRRTARTNNLILPEFSIF